MRRNVWLAGLICAAVLGGVVAGVPRVRVDLAAMLPSTLAWDRLVPQQHSPGRDPAGEPLASRSPETASAGPGSHEVPRRHALAWSVLREEDRSIALEGALPSPDARAALLRAAATAAEGVPVEDRTTVDAGARPAAPESAAASLVGRLLALLARGRIDVADDRLSIAGEAPDPDAVAEIGTVLEAGLPTAGLARGDVDVAPRPLSPYRAAIRREADRVVLTGHLPDARTRAGLTAALRERLFGERIVDRTRTLARAPDALARVLLAGVDLLGLLAEGEIETRDQAIRITGRSPYRESARALAATARRIAPAGWTAEVAVDGPDDGATVDPAACRRRFAESTAPRPLRFPPGSADLPPDAYPLLDALAALAAACPTERIEIAGYDDPPSPEHTASAGPRPVAAVPGREAAAARMRPAPAVAAKVGPASSRSPVAKPASMAAPAAAEPAPEPDLPRRRANALVDYLVKAGAPERRVIAVDPEAPSARQVGLTLRSR